MADLLKYFERLELKYILTLEQKNIFLKTFNNILIPDQHGDTDGNYSLESIYYDSDDLVFYRQKNCNKKIRIRIYKDNTKLSDTTPVFVEIKENIKNITLKRRIKLTYQEAYELLEKKKIPKHKKEDNSIISEILSLATQYQLRPSAITRYDRQAFFGHNKEQWIRISLDTNVNYTTQGINTDKKQWKIIDNNMVIMELKANNEIPKEFVEFFEKNNIQPSRMSKYCQAIEKSEKFGK